MEPFKPQLKQKILATGASEHDIERYEEHLVNRFMTDPNFTFDREKYDQEMQPKRDEFRNKVYQIMAESNLSDLEKSNILSSIAGSVAFMAMGGNGVVRYDMA